MRNSHIEYPSLKPIKGTDLAYILAPCAVNKKNGYDKYIDYLASKTNGEVIVENSSKQRVLREYCYKVYKRQGKTIEELEQDIKTNNAILVGDMVFNVSGNNFELDDNDNLLLRSYGSDLDGIKKDGGDVLISSSGKILRNSKGHMFIHPADPFGNYPCDIFVAKSKGMFEDVEIVRIDYNFLTPDGHLVTQHNFQRVDKTDKPVIQEVSRTFSDESEGKKFIDSSKIIYPKAYVCDFGKQSEQRPMFFPSATALLIENRSRIADGEAPIVEDETPYVIEHYKRMKEIPTIQRKLSEKSAKGSMKFPTYIKAITNISNEEMLFRIFGEMETDRDREIQEDLEFEGLTFGEE